MAMKLYKTESGSVIEDHGEFYELPEQDWDVLLNRNDHEMVLTSMTRRATRLRGFNVQECALAPIGHQEVWAAGVTYFRSRTARIEESKDAGGGDFYARVYDAARPELFFKATAYRTVGSGDAVRIRKDSKWNVPEPELTLFISSKGTIEGYTIGNDMSSRDIEGENPLYLPQAKSYNGSAAIGPCLYVPESSIDPDSMIKLEITRSESCVFSGNI